MNIKLRFGTMKKRVGQHTAHIQTRIFMKLEIKTAFLRLIMHFFHESELLIKCAAHEYVKKNSVAEPSSGKKRSANNWQTDLIA